MTNTEEEQLDATEQRTAVRDRYETSATESSCCGDDDLSTEQSEKLGYSEEDMESVGEEAYLGLGCGNPTGIASLEEGDIVLDLGAGAGFDCFLAGQEVGDTGQVIGVDMTPEMVEKARKNIEENGVDNVEFRLSEIEHLPVADGAIDVIISNCVINLSPDKRQVFSEVYRVLRPGGRIAISDNVVTSELPEDVQNDPESVAACVGGASSIPELESILSGAGFTDISIEVEEERDEVNRERSDDIVDGDITDYIKSAMIEATKPEA